MSTQISEQNIDEIKKWETLEVERSASEAQRRGNENLRLRDDIVERYLSPPADTPFHLEYSYHMLGDVTGKTVLDYGCGMGENSVLVAAHGGKVIGVDISPESLELASKRMEQHGYADRAEFRVGSAHDLPLEDESVDVVFGMAILHHLDLEIASKEVFRVLKKGGRAIFQEPVRNSKFIWFVRNLIPYQQPDVSPYERPLTDAELEKFAEPFSNYKSRAFALPIVSLAEVTGMSENVKNSVQRFDAKVRRVIPALDYYATIRVIEMTK